LRAWILFLVATIAVYLLGDYLHDGMIDGSLFIAMMNYHVPPVVPVTHGHSEVSHNKWRSKLTKRIVAKKILKSIKRQ